MTTTYRRRVWRRVLERFVAVVLGLAGLGLAVTVWPPATAVATPARAPTATQVAVSAAPAVVAASAGLSTARRRAVIDRIAFDYLPAGLGRPSSFTYQFQGVSFVSRVWETYRSSTGWRTDLQIQVMRGARLSSPLQFRRWFIGYEQRDPKPRYLAFRVHRHPGWLTQDQVFWLIRPGLAVSVTLTRPPWTTYDAVQTAWYAHRLQPRTVQPLAQSVSRAHPIFERNPL